MYSTDECLIDIPWSSHLRRPRTAWEQERQSIETQHDCARSFTYSKVADSSEGARSETSWSEPAKVPRNLPNDGIDTRTDDLELSIESLYDKLEGLIFQQQATGSDFRSELRSTWTKIEQLESQALEITYQKLEQKRSFPPSEMRAFLKEAHEFMKHES